MACTGKCKKFRVSKPRDAARYSSGQCHCQMCDTWMDHNGCHLSDSSPATESSDGWFCRCCGFKVRRKPRNTNYKAKFRSASRARAGGGPTGGIDLSYFNKYRAIMIKQIALHMLEGGGGGGEDKGKKGGGGRMSARRIGSKLLENGISAADVRTEFDAPIEAIIDLARTLDPPNKISMILEFERIRSLIKRVPAKRDIAANSDLTASQYESEFESWEHLLDRLGYDPWYRGDAKPSLRRRRRAGGGPPAPPEPDRGPAPPQSLKDIRSAIRRELKGEPDTLKLFDTLDRNIAKCDELELGAVLESLG